MKLAKILLPDGVETVGLIENEHVAPLALASGQYESLFEILESDDPARTAEFLIDADRDRLPLDEVTLLAPIDRQEIWAAGVTYRRSRTARMEESKGAAQFYDLVYESMRPELFFKANARRVAGPGQKIRVRSDSKWTVPEPELALVLSSKLGLVGFTIGNDMSARDIEGENPLYLPQAKMYDACCGLGPCVTLARAMPPRDETAIEMVVRRRGAVAFEGKTTLRQMVRSYDELIEYLACDNVFPDGAILLTGTGIVPPDEFSLADGDIVEITIDGIGTLTSPVVQG
jgi:2-dehydro-3-deoxy-D-arabinonate dehydratase